MKACRLLLADDPGLFRDALESALGRCEEFDVVGTADTAQQTMRKLRRTTPDVLLVAFGSNLKGLDVVRSACAQKSAPRCLVLSLDVGPQLVLEALRAGAAGVLRKETSFAELREAVATILGGEVYLENGLAIEIAARVAGRPNDSLSELTIREREVLRLLASGLSSKEISQKLDLSPRTVESHRAAMMRKLKVNKVAGLVRYAIRERIVDP